MKTVQIGPLSTFKRRTTHLALGLGLAATLALGAVMPAGADDGTGTVVLSAGTRSVAIDNFSFTARTLNGSDQLSTVAPVIAVVDPSGSSLGWNVTMGASAFTDGASKTLAAAPRVTGSTLTDDNNADAAHTNGVSGTVSVAGAGGKIASSAAGASSNGAFTLTPTIEIDIPYNTEVATYTSTVTVTITQAP